jgi:GNAT superfamily N-acetyltransferase
LVSCAAEKQRFNAAHLKQSAMRRNPNDHRSRMTSLAEIQAVTHETRPAAIELLARFFCEEGFATPRSRIEENLERMLADSSCWCALALRDGAAQAVITVSTVLYVEWGRLGEIGDLYVLPEHRRRGLAGHLIEHAKDWCRSQGCTAIAVTITPFGEQRHRLSQFYAAFGFEQTGRMSASATL